MTDEDVAAARAAGFSEDQIFELMVCAAVGAADRQYDSAMAGARRGDGRWAMRLEILDSGHRLSARALFGVIRLMTRQPVVDAVKLAFYRKDFYGAGPLTNEAMRGPSQWSVGERELMAAFVAKANECPFCVAAHSATSGLWYGDDAKVAATLADLDTAPIDRAAAGDAAHARQAQPRAQRRRRRHPAVLDAGVTPAQIEDALAVSLAFDITARLANAFDFDLASPAAMTAGAEHLLKRGYG